MTDFRFNFEQTIRGDAIPTACQHSTESHTMPVIEKLNKCREVECMTSGTGIDDSHSKGPRHKVCDVRLCDGTVHLQHIDLDVTEAELKTENSELKSALNSRSDLVPYIYEGGLKIWECAIDLILFLHQCKVDFENKSVLELGCGVGLPGIYTLTKGAVVHFQDYNVEVIKHVTIPSVAMNTSNGPDRHHKFYAGEWGSLPDLLNPAKADSKKFDFILTSETIYNPDSYPSLIHVVKQLLKRTGVAYLAAKSHYFGVGGSIDLFTEAIDKDGTLVWETVSVVAAGIPRKTLCIIQK
ncbi:histidine protein methyltransferase 1 homolog isoform X2 [Corticium candelabrum]|uniref:histidine protein methyltransferase 1 homolog isoform X2 n=1 Tax=Corticium candelabrum TaxID=121492 RepID=UPI002E255FF0|nr:histidine protein methyltransferase 1 homolog isoform X2 [Corticium candelabrum]